MQNTGRNNGYVIVTKRSTANYCIYFQCDRGGTYRTKKISTKNTGTKKIDCLFALKGKYSSANDCWSLKSICEIHNHEPALYLEGHPYPRRLSQNETRLVEDLIKQNVKPKDILSTLKKQNVEILSILPTIYNAKQKFKMKENMGKTKMQVAMSFLKENYYIYYSRSDPSTNELQDLFFAHQNLIGRVSFHALEKIFKEFEQINSIEMCGCQMRTSYGLPCAHEQTMYLRNRNPLPLDSVHIFWKKFDLHPYIFLEDDDVDIDVEVQTSNTMIPKVVKN